MSHLRQESWDGGDCEAGIGATSDTAVTETAPRLSKRLKMMRANSTLPRQRFSSTLRSAAGASGASPRSAGLL
jgi:hypothetical protein